MVIARPTPMKLMVVLVAMAIFLVAAALLHAGALSAPGMKAPDTSVLGQQRPVEELPDVARPVQALPARPGAQPASQTADQPSSMSAPQPAQGGHGPGPQSLGQARAGSTSVAQPGVQRGSTLLPANLDSGSACTKPGRC